jgi:thioredoxin 1
MIIFKFIFSMIQINLTQINYMGNDTSVLPVNNESWEKEVLKSQLPVFVDFWAEWCGPCRMVGPAVEQLSKSLDGKVKIVKLNVDENQEIAVKYGIHSIPSLLLFKDGNEIARTVGAAPKEAYQKFIEESLARN